MKGLRLYKKEKLCSQVAIDTLFSRGAGTSSAIAYPLRVVWRDNPRRHSNSPLAFMISVPKRRLRHAVDRVTMRRRIREAYRLSRLALALPQGSRVDLAIVYVADKPMPYQAVEAALTRLLNQIQCQTNRTAASSPGQQSPC